MSDLSWTGDEALEAGLRAGYATPPASVLAALERATGAPVTRVTLRERSARAPAPPAGAVAEGPSPAPAGRSSYQVRGQLGRGGMGVLLECRDVDLGRDVAVKVLREDLAGRPEFVQRFVEEARIGGQLQHPGVVPVYELGLMSDERPYFAMKLVQGRTLADELAERSATGRRRLLDVYASVCQTVAYAHARGVVHRDLKPANVMVGDFGEVQVIDWGLAKVLASVDAPASSAPPERARTGASSRGTPSVAGSVMGTPAYTSPEQARGELGRVDERTDVFALGAILCELLTGAPPFPDENQHALAQAAAGELDGAHARLAACGADPELVALCRACLAPELDDRPRSAAEVARRVQEYLASLEERARRAEVRAAEARVRARSTVVLTAVGAAVVLVSLSLTWVWRAERARQAADTRRAVVAALTEATLARGAGDWAAAETALERAEARAETAPAEAALSAQVAAARAEFARELQAARAREQLERDNAIWLAALDAARWPEGDRVYPTDWAALDREFALLFAARGAVVDTDAPEALARALAARGIPLELAAALDAWSGVRRGALDDAGADRLRRLADALDSDPLRSELRAAHAAQDLPALLEIGARAQTTPLPPQTLRLLAHELRTGPALALGIELLGAGCRRHPQDYGLALELARALQRADPPRIDEALSRYEVAVALRPGSVAAWHELGMALHPLAGRADAAAALFREAVARFPEDGHLHFHLGTAELVLGELDLAVVSLERAAELEPEFALTWINLASALDRLGRTAEAVHGYERALALQPGQVDALVGLGVALRRLARLDEAAACFEQALALDPDRASAHVELAWIHSRRSAPAAVIDHAEAALAAAPDSSYVCFLLAQALADVGRAAEARAAFERCLELAPGHVQARHDLVLLLLGTEQVRDPRGAVEHARRLLELAPEGADHGALLGIALYASGDTAEARDVFARLAAAEPDGALPALFLGLCALRADAPEEGLALLAGVDLDGLAQAGALLAPFVEEARARLDER